MTQQEAINLLGKMLGKDLAGLNFNCTGNTNTCNVDECMICSIRDCPGNEPLHYHHDGCPFCFYLNKE